MGLTAFNRARRAQDEGESALEQNLTQDEVESALEQDLDPAIDKPARAKKTKPTQDGAEA